MNNHDLLFLYDAKLTNPNGDADDENRPRMDYERSINLVSDVRLKRYIRDYLANKGEEVFVSHINDKPVTATERLELLFQQYGEEIKLSNVDQEARDWMLDQLTDVRLFGATMPIKAKDNKGGSSMTFTGPAQFNWGYSLNRVSLVESNTITSHFKSSSQNEKGSMGKDFRLYYSLLAFHGLISGHRAKHTRLKEKDIDLLDNALLKSIPLQVTRSKSGQFPRLYVRVEYTSNEFIAGDLRDYLELEDKDSLRSISEVKLNVDRLINKLASVESEIKTINIWQEDGLNLKSSDGEGSLISLLPQVLIDRVNEIQVAGSVGV